jgi:MFS family permease
MTRSWVQLSFTTYLPEWLQGQGWTMAGSGRMLTALLIAISLGTLIGGSLSDRIGRWQVLALSLVLLAPLLGLACTLLYAAHRRATVQVVAK